MVATSGDSLIDEEGRSFLRQYLLPLTTVATPNIPEAEFLTGRSITTEDDMKGAAEYLVHEYGVDAALIKGGHLKGQAIDFLYDGKKCIAMLQNALIRRIRTEQAVPMPLRLLLIWGKAVRFRKQ